MSLLPGHTAHGTLARARDGTHGRWTGEGAGVRLAGGASGKERTQSCSVDGPVRAEWTKSRSKGGESRASPPCACRTTGCCLRGAGQGGGQGKGGTERSDRDAPHSVTDLGLGAQGSCFTIRLGQGTDGSGPCHWTARHAEPSSPRAGRRPCVG